MSAGLSPAGLAPAGLGDPPAASGGATVSPPLLSNSSTLYAPSVSGGSVNVAPPLLTNGNTIYAPSVAGGSVSVSPPLLTNTSTLYGPAVSGGLTRLIVNTELGSSGYYVNLGSPSGLDDIGEQTWIAYARPSGAGGGNFAYLFGKTTAGSTLGPRWFINNNSGSPRLSFGAATDGGGGSGVPQVEGQSNEVVYNTWQHYELTWDGGILASGIHLSVEGTEGTKAVATDGSGSVMTDAANDLFLMNRGAAGNLGREFNGDLAYIACWDRILDSTAKANVRANGPLAEPSGLILCWANQVDNSSNSIVPTARATHVNGSLPPNLALGGLVVLPPLLTNASTLYGPTVASGTGTVYPPLLTNANTFYGPTVTRGSVTVSPGLLTNSSTLYAPTVGDVLTVQHDIDTGNIDPAGVTVTNGASSTPTVALRPRYVPMQNVVTNFGAQGHNGDGGCWIHFHFRLDHANGKQPTFTFETAWRWWSDGGTGYPYASSWRPVYSYDLETWTPVTNAPSNLTSPARKSWQFDSAFTQDTVYVADHPVWTYAHFEALAAALVADSSGLVHLSAAADGDGVIGQSPAETDDLGRAVGGHDMFGFRIEDTSYTTAADGGPKRVAVLDAGLHGGEMLDGFGLLGFINWALTDSGSNAVAFRRNWRVFLYFGLNPNGRFGGAYSGHWDANSRNVVNTNRDWNDSTGFGYQESQVVRDAVNADIGGAGSGARIDAALSFHSSIAATKALNAQVYSASGFYWQALKTAIETVDSDTLDLTDVSATTNTTSHWLISRGAKLGGAIEPALNPYTSRARLEEIGAHYAEALQLMQADGVFGKFVQPGLLTNANTLFAPSVAGGLKTVAPPLLTNTSSLYAPTVTRGQVAVQPPLLTNASTLYVPSVGAGQSVSAPLLSNTSAVLAPVVTPGGVVLHPGILVNTSQALAPSVVPGAVEVEPGLLLNQSVLFAPLIATDDLAYVLPPLLVNGSILFSPSIQSGGRVLGSLVGSSRKSYPSRPQAVQTSQR